MKEKMSISQVISVSLMLFAIFFGAGNMIFPPALGEMAGSNYISAVLGFIVTDAGLAILGIIAVVFVGNQMRDLGGIVNKTFSYLLPIGVYLLIGPLFALPRTGSVSFELAILPFITGTNKFTISVLFTGVFFLVTYWLSSNPNKIVDIVGKMLTPVLLISIAIIFIGSLTHPLQQVSMPAEGYDTIPFFKGMIEGYLALDGPAGLAFSIIIINAIKNCGISEKKSIIKYTVVCGIFAGLFLSVIYLALAYIGAHAAGLGSFGNGGQLLSAVTYELFGTKGQFILGIAVLFACLTTSIGLTTSFADYFHELFPNMNYKTLAKLVCFFSFIISNVGLTTLIKVSLPVLIMIYPVTVVLIVLSFFHHKINDKKYVYILGMLFTFIVAFVDGLNSAHITLGPITDFVTALPLYELGLSWIIPAIIGSILGLLPIFPKQKS